MSEINKQKTHKPKDAWVDTVLYTECNREDDWLTVGSIVVGAGVAAISGNGFLGIGLGTACWLLSVKRIADTDYVARISLESDIAAPFLEKKNDFLNYLDQYGKDTALAEIEYAKTRGANLSDVADEWYTQEMKLLHPPAQGNQRQVVLFNPLKPKPAEPDASPALPTSAAPIADLPDSSASAAFNPAQYPDLQERAMALMEAMAKDGMPIGKILHHPFVMLVGGSQSGKTSVAAILSILRLAIGKQVAYATVDNDIPPIAWSELAATPEAYRDLMANTAERISNADKGSLAGHSWVFDELLRTAQEHKLNITQLLVPCLAKGAKTLSSVIVLTHAKTMSAHKIETGFSESWQRDRVEIEAIRAADEFGTYAPTGRYTVSLPGEPSTEWKIPDWMLIQGDPVGWVLGQFPELKRPDQLTHPRIMSKSTASTVSQSEINPIISPQPSQLEVSAETIAAILEAYDRGVSMTKIVEEIMGRRGPHFPKGRQLYFQVIQQYRSGDSSHKAER